MKFDLNDIPKEMLMDFINGKYSLPEERNMGDDVDFVIVNLNRICEKTESIKSLDAEGRAHLFECVGAYCFNMFHAYKNIDITDPEGGIDKTIEHFYLKACEWNEEMKAMKELHKKFSK